MFKKIFAMFASMEQSPAATESELAQERGQQQQDPKLKEEMRQMTQEAMQRRADEEKAKQEQQGEETIDVDKELAA